MNFNPIHWLRLAKPLPVKIKTHIDAHVVHKYDPKVHELTQPSECCSYHNENKTDLDFLAKKIFKDYNE